MKQLRRLSTGLGASTLLLLSVLGLSIPAAAQTSTVPDLSQFGYPRVTASADFTPGQATTVAAGTQRVDLPADFMGKPVKFEFLEGDPASFALDLAPADQGKQLVAAFAFRVTDSSTGQLVGKFDKPVVYSITAPGITSDSEVYNTSPSNPPAVTDNPTAPTIQGTTLSHSFGGAGVGWLIASPALPAGMPSTGAPQPGAQFILFALAGLSLAGVGSLVLRRSARRA